MRDEILKRLKMIADVEQASILYACESGSRAWGFPSADSDYDVRFIYARDRDWYLSIDVEEKRDVIEQPINDELDVSGWDIRKALQLLRKSNPPLLEWLSSPIVYQEKPGVAEKLREAMAEFYSPISSFHHYLSMARNNHREFLRGDLIRVKKYFYVLRPLLAIRWIEQDIGPVPMEFDKLVDQCIASSDLRDAIGELVERKRSGEEVDSGPKIPIISSFIDAEIIAQQERIPPQREKPDFERLNDLFRDLIGS